MKDTKICDLPLNCQKKEKILSSNYHSRRQKTQTPKKTASLFTKGRQNICSLHPIVSKSFSLRRKDFSIKIIQCDQLVQIISNSFDLFYYFIFISQDLMQHQQLQQSKILKEAVAFEKKWLGIKHISFTIGDKVIENYESAYRPGRIKTAFNVDGVEVLPIFKRKDKTLDLIMIANFRPPIGKFCLEFPAGLVEDANFEENAARELKEETGYKAERFLNIPEVLTHCDPWKSSEGGYLYVAIINQEDPTHYEKQELQNSQNIRVLTFKMDDDLPENVCKFAEEHNYGINGRAWSIILGLNFHQYL